MQTTMIVLKSKLDDKSSLLSKDQKIALVIQNELDPLRESLKAMDVIVHSFIGSNNVTFKDRVQFATVDKGRIQDLQAQFRKAEALFDSMLLLVNSKAVDIMIHNDKAILQKFNEIAQKQEAVLKEQKKLSNGQKGQNETREKERENLSRSIDNALETVAGMNSPLSKPGLVEKKTLSTILDQFESELRKNGLATKKAKAMRLKASENLEEKSSKLGAVDTDESPIRTYGNLGPSQCDIREQCRIMCVDSSHGISSRLAHFYLEVWRTIEAAQSGRWLFKRVDSAGLHVGQGKWSDPALTKKRIDEMSDELVSNEFKLELKLDSIKTRIKKYQASAFTIDDMVQYHYILLCGPYGNEMIRRYKQAQEQFPNKRLATIIRLESCDSAVWHTYLKDEFGRDQIISSIGKEIFKIVRQPPLNFPRTKASIGFSGEVRAFVAFDSNLKYLDDKGLLEGGQSLKNVERLSGCAVKVTRYRSGSGQVLVNILGQADCLAYAKRLIVKDDKKMFS